MNISHMQLELQEAYCWSDHYKGLTQKSRPLWALALTRTGSAVAGLVAKLDILAFNRVIGLGLEEPAGEEQIDEIISLYRDAEVNRFFIQISPKALPPSLPDILLKRGFRHHNNWMKLYRTVEPFPEIRSEFRISVIDGNHARLFSDMLATCFEWPDIVKPFLAAPIGRPGWTHYLLYYGDTPAACAALFIRGEYASLAFAGTMPDFRGRGAQAALISRRFRDAASAGCRWMVTETAEETPDRSVASYRNMLRNGFQVAYRRPNYIYERDPSGTIL
jgi:GNAT superfamily N-acetyltransferase